LHVLAHGPQTLADLRQTLVSIMVMRQSWRGFPSSSTSVPPCVIPQSEDSCGRSNKVLMPMLTVRIREVPEHWLVADRDHRLWDVVTVVPDARSHAAAEENYFHVNTVPIIYRSTMPARVLR
jgi:hypothetical protein